MDNGHEISGRTRGQGSLITTFGAAVAVALIGYKDPYALPLPDELIHKAIEVVGSASKPKSPHECLMLALSHSPPLGCSPQRK
jgi:hypothetical protein